MFVTLFKETKMAKEKTQVDFELLNYTAHKYDAYRTEELTEEDLNVQLFFKMLTTSSTFAHKVHKELKKLENDN